MDPIVWAELTAEQTAAKIAEISTKMDALIAKAEAAEKAKAAGAEDPGGLSNDERKELASLTESFNEGRSLVSGDDPVLAAREARNAANTSDEDSVADNSDSTGSGDQVAEDAAEMIAQLEADLAEKNAMLAKAAASHVAGVTDANNEDATQGEDTAEVGARASLMVYSPETGTLVEGNVHGMAVAARAALAGRDKVVLAETTQYDASDAPMLTQHNVADHGRLMLEAKARYLAAQAACTDGCKDALPIWNRPSEVMERRPTPFIDRAVPIEAAQGCGVKTYRPTSPVVSTDYDVYLTCYNVGTAQAPDYQVGWIDQADAFTQQTETNGVPLDKPIETLDPSCFTAQTTTLEAMFKNLWIRESDMLCNEQLVEMALDRYVGTVDRNTDRRFADVIAADALAGGHSYTFTANNSRSAVTEFAWMLNEALPGEQHAWDLDLSMYTPVWSLGAASHLNLDYYRADGGAMLRTVLEDAGVDFESGFESRNPLPGSTAPPWRGVADSAVDLGATTYTGTDTEDVRSHTLMLVDFSQVGNLGGPTRRVTLDNSPSARAKNAAFWQYERYNAPIMIGHVPALHFVFTSSPNGTLSARQNFTADTTQISD